MVSVAGYHRVMRWGWLVLLAGCFGPRVPAGAPCETTAGCPSGQVCTPHGGVSTCEAPGTQFDDGGGIIEMNPDGPPAPLDGGTMLDLDGDSIPNASDNCPTVPNVDQYNEDGDRFGDACDPCPPVADDNPTDGDGDGVADACDPNPSTPGDSITLFEGFHAGVPTTGWFKTGTWTAANDSVTAEALTSKIHLVLPAPGGSTHELVATEVTVDDLTDPTHDASVGVVDDYNHQSRTGMACHLTQWADGSRPLAMTDLKKSDGELADYEIVAGRTYSVGSQRDGNDYMCGAIHGVTSAAGTDSYTTMTVNSTPEVGLRVVYAKATFKWLMVIGQP
jgi:Thrombospondin type 3 repeat